MELLLSFHLCAGSGDWTLFSRLEHQVHLLLSHFITPKLNYFKYKFYFIYFFILNLFTLHSDHGFPSRFSSLSFPLPPPALPFTPLPFLFRKTHAFHGYHKTWLYQVAEKLSSSSCFKAEQGNPAWGIGSQKPAKELDSGPAPTVRNPTEDQATQLLAWIFN